MKRIGAIFAASNTELTTAPLATKRFASRALVLNTDSGELRQGPGFWAEMKPLTIGAHTEVVAATTANITIATALNAGDTLDGVTLAAGDLVLVKDQNTASQNGIYVVGSSPARAAAFDTWDEHVGKLVRVLGGTTNKYKLFRLAVASGGTLNTTDVTVVEEVPGVLNFSNADVVDLLPKFNGATVDDTSMVLLVDSTTKQVGTVMLSEIISRAQA